MNQTNSNKGDILGFYTKEYRDKVSSGYFQTPYLPNHYGWELLKKGIIANINETTPTNTHCCNFQNFFK